MAWKHLCAAVVLLLSYYIYTVAVLLDVNTTIVMKNNERCEKISLPMATEDLAVFGQFLIGATSDLGAAFYKHFGAAEGKPGYLISINPSTKAVKKILTHGFPAEFNLHGHGIRLYGKTLYVISHGYAKGGERVFLFDLEIVDGEVEATYKDSYHFEGEHGMYNGIAVVDEKHFYITQWLPFPDEENGRDNSVFVGMMRTLISLYFESIPVKFCTVIEKGKVTCAIKAFGGMPNGVVYEDKTLYVADSTHRCIRVYTVSDNFDLSLVTKVSIQHSVDNLFLSNGQLYVAGLARALDYLQLNEAIKNGRPHNNVPGGVSQIDLRAKQLVSKLAIMQDVLSLPTSVAVTDRIFVSSIHDPELLVCPIPFN